MSVSPFRIIPQRLWTSPSRPLPKHLDELADIGQENNAISAKKRDAIWHAMKGFYRTGINPGVTLAIRHEGKLVFNRALGYSQLDTGKLLKVDDPVCLFSASKAVTATLIHALIEDGKLSLKDKVADYLPEYGCNGKENTTIRDLLSHRAGIPRLEGADPSLLFTPEDGISMLCAAKPVNAVGKRQAYHAITAGFILGEVAKRITGKDLNQQLETRIRQPLGMTYFRYGLDEADKDRVPFHYLTGVNNALLDRYISHAVGADLRDVIDVSNDKRFMDPIIPAGNLYATAEETTRFYQLLLNNGSWEGQQLLKTATIRNAVKPVSAPLVIDGSLLLPIRFSAGFMLGARALSIYGPNTPRAFGHLGFLSITTWADPARDLSVALLTTGKGVLGPQYPALIRLLNRVNAL